MRFYFSKIMGVSLFLASLVSFLLIPSALAADTRDSRAVSEMIFHQDWERASNEELDTLRGGFVLPDGVYVNMSLEKFVHLNGEPITSSSFQLPQDGLLIQNGIQNLVSDTGAVPELGIFIQNTLDNQHIETLTKVNIELGNLKEVMERGGRNNYIFTDFVAPTLSR